MKETVAKNGTANGTALQVYLLGTVEFETALTVQQRLVYDIAGDRTSAALILCEHPSLITVGRQGSRAHILCEPEELRSRRWPIRWINRGGGCLLHVPGQLAIYPVLPLDALGLGLQDYLDRLQEVLIATLAEFSVRGAACPEQAGVWVGPRPIGLLGVAVRDWISYFGAYLNINPSLDLFRRVQCGGTLEPMTSLERERHGPLRPALVRERLLELFLTRFGFARVSLFFHHPLLGRKAAADALATHS